MGTGEEVLVPVGEILNVNGFSVTYDTLVAGLATRLLF